jgi:predicted alpha/beta superfamily hydrolase
MLLRNGFVLMLCTFGLVSSALGQSEGAAGTEAQTQVTIRFNVTVPDNTPADAAVYLSGGSPQFGRWDGQGLKLDRDDDGHFVKEVVLERGMYIEFKATLGTWERVEKSAVGGEIDNRHVTADTDKRVRFVVASWADGQADHPAPSLTGDIRKHEKFHSAILDNDRTLLVYLPPGYDDQPGRRYPVLYMHDGQNIFDASTSFAGVEWRVDEAAERLIKAGDIEPIIIVGMYNNADRMTEYTPGPVGERGDAYARFVVEEVKPFIDRTYRTNPAREKTGIAGSSLGGLISLYMAGAYPDVFGRCSGVSPSLGFRDSELLKQWVAGDHRWMKDTRFWIDMGTNEGRPAPGGSVTTAVLNARALKAVFDQAGLVRGEGYQYLEVQGGRHNEKAWSERIEDVLMFLYGH